MESIIQTLAIAALPIIFAITLHEAAHGYAARLFGDPTAHQAGRISLNPLRHIDPMGTVIVPVLILVVSRLAGGGGILFGWAKPVPVNFARLRRPKRDMLWVAAAGPLMNLLMALAWGGMLKMAWVLPDNFFTLPMAEMAKIGIEINMVLMVLNLFPLPPLDGGRIAVSLLPHSLAWKYARIEPYGFPILLLLLFTGVLGMLISPFIMIGQALIYLLFQIPF